MNGREEGVVDVGRKRFEEIECAGERCTYGGEDAGNVEVVMEMEESLAELNN